MTTDLHLTRAAASKAQNRRIAIIAATLVAGLLGSGALVLRGTEAAFTSTTENAANTWTAGSVALTDTDLGFAMFVAPGSMYPGQTLTRCITVNYAGTIAAPVKLYATTLTGTLAPYLDITVNEGSGATDAACTNFVAAGADLEASSTLAAFATAHTNWASGIGTWSPSSASSKSYRFTVTLQPTVTDAQQSATASVKFVWDAKVGT
jgi:hypothetical protein